MTSVNGFLQKKGDDASRELMVSGVNTSFTHRWSPVIAAAMFGSTLLMSGCSQSEQSGFEEVSVEASSEYANESTADAGMIDQSDPLELTAEASSQDEALVVENLSGNSEQTLGSQAADIQIAGKKLLINASANFIVKDVVKSRSAIENLTRQQGGYVALSNTYNHPRNEKTFVRGDKNITITTYNRQAEMTVRVPRVNVNTFLKQMQQQVAFLNAQEFTAQDVTLDIYREQLASQLNSDMAEELSQERLNSKNDKDQRSNIDAITASYAARRQKELAQLEKMDIADKVKYSTINLSFMQPDISYKETTQNLEVLIDAERPSFNTQVNKAFKDGWEILRAIALGLIQLWWLLVVGAVLYLIYRIIKAIYQKLFKNDPRIDNIRRDLMGESQESNDVSDTKRSQVNDHISRDKKVDITDDKRSD